MNEVASIYDNLFSYESKKKLRPYPIHKKLALDGFSSIPDWLLSQLKLNEGDRVLDAGCGTGHTLFLLNARKPIIGKGISISPKEIAFANAQNESSNLNFEVFDFDNPLNGRFDKIIAIESLKHSKNLPSAVDNFLSSLLEGGSLVIADDFLTNTSSDFEKHAEYWKATSFGSIQTLKTYLSKKDNLDILEYDFTDRVPSRSTLFLQVLIVGFSILKTISMGSLNRNIRTYIGGLLLEKLYAKKAVGYHILVVKKF